VRCQPSRRCGVEADTDEQTILGGQPRDRLAPRLRAWPVQQPVSAVEQLLHSGRDVSYLELGTCLLSRHILWPVRQTEARVSRSGERPEAQVLDLVEPLRTSRLRPNGT
jgi:hypothetical protein